MTQQFFIGTTLPGMNEIIAAAKSRKGNWSAYANMKLLYGSLIKADIKAAKLTPMTRVSLWFVWHERNKKRDKDNIAAGGVKFINDALVAAGILKNDGWAEIAAIHHAWVVSPQKPGCEVVLEETV